MLFDITLIIMSICHFMSSFVHRCPCILKIMEGAMPDKNETNPFMTDDQTTMADVL